MSAEPLTAQNTVIIVECRNANQAADRIAAYGPQVTAQVSMVLVMTIAQAHDAAMLHPGDTPWTIIEEPNPAIKQVLEDKFGPSRAFASALDCRNNEFAVSPRLLNT